MALAVLLGVVVELEGDLTLGRENWGEGDVTAAF